MSQQQQQLVQQNMDSLFVAPLPRSLVTKAKTMFDLYIETFQRQKQEKKEKDSSSSSSSKEEQQQQNMTAGTLAKLLEDLGVPTTENDARSLIFSMTQSAALSIAAEESVQRNRTLNSIKEQQQQSQQQAQQQQQQGSKGGKSGGGRARAQSLERSNSRRSSASQPSVSGAGGGLFGNDPNLSSSSSSSGSHREHPQHHSQSSGLSLNFEMFLRVLQMPFKSLREIEMQQLWTELDRDGDGVLSVRDVALSMTRFNNGMFVPSSSSTTKNSKKSENPNSISAGSTQQQQLLIPTSPSSPSVAAAVAAGNDSRHPVPRSSSQKKKQQPVNKTGLAKHGLVSSSQAGGIVSAASEQKEEMQELEEEKIVFQSPWTLDHLSEQQLEALLHELDEDGDGVVSYADLASSLHNT